MSPELPQNIKLGQIRRTAGMATPSEWSKLSRDEQEAVDALSWQIVWRCRQKRHPALEGEDCIFLTVRHVQRLVAAVDAALHDQKNLLAAFLVFPNTRAASSREPEYLQIVPVGDLERNCERFRLD